MKEGFVDNDHQTSGGAIAGDQRSAYVDLMVAAGQMLAASNMRRAAFCGDDKSLFMFACQRFDHAEDMLAAALHKITDRRVTAQKELTPSVSREPKAEI